jgi:hypothetical protein
VTGNDHRTQATSAIPPNPPRRVWRKNAAGSVIVGPVHLLEGSWAKLERAREHFEFIETELRTNPDGRFWEENPDPLVAEVEAEGREHALYLRLRKEPDFQRWGLLLGDGMHNLRSALDLAVYELAIRASGKDPPPWSM